MNNLSNSTLSLARRQLSLAFLFFSGCGIPLIKFKGVQILWLFVIAFVCFANLKKISIKSFKVPCLISIILIIIYILKGSQPPLFICVAIFTSYIVLISYKDGVGLFLRDFSLLCKYFSYYSLLSFLVLFIFKDQLTPSPVASFYRHFCFLFYYVDNGGPSFVNGYRVVGLAWEPGIWQMIMNFNLFFALKEKRKVKEILLGILSVILTFSTTGIFIMAIVIGLYYLTAMNRRELKKLFIPAFLIVLLFPIISFNVSDKIYGQGATSALVRFGDFIVGSRMLARSPFLGEDPKSTLNSEDQLILQIRQEMWDDTKGNSDGFLNAEIVNGIMIFLLDFGLFVGLYLLYKVCKSKIWGNEFSTRSILLLILFLTLNSEPISRTGFFFFFVLSGFML